MSRSPEPSRTRALSRRRALAVLALGLAAGGCSGDDPTGLARCDTDVTVSVSAEPAPRFTWSPACGATALFVESVDGGDAWYLTATTPAGIPSGVTYGVVPAGAVEDAPAVALEEGRTYFVYVAKGPDDDPSLAGLRSFAP